MPRGAFQGTFHPNARATVAMAPGVVVHFNGVSDVVGCPQCSRKFDFNRHITNVQVDLGVNSSPGSATVGLAIPRHSIDDFYFDGNPVITPMMEVEIYAKGCYLVEGVPQYYPIFWGIVTEVNDSYSSGEHTVSIQCSDILKWWDLCRINICNTVIAPSGQQGQTITGNVFTRTNPYDIIFQLATTSFGDVLYAAGVMKNLVREAAQAESTNTFTAALGDMMLYWQQRFGRMRSNLLLYGASGVAVRGETLYQAYSSALKTGAVNTKNFVATQIRNANGENGAQAFFDPADDEVTCFKLELNSIGPALWQSEYQTKLELATTAKEAIGYEFFMDVTGDIVFKPPFFNLDVIGNKPVSWIQDIDIISWDFSESESEVVTQLAMAGEYVSGQNVGINSEVTKIATSVTDYHLLRRYGWRPQPYNSEYMSDPVTMFYHGLDVLDRINSKRHRCTIVIPLRPELRLGFPIYIAPKDQLWYVEQISHTIGVGGQATTSLQLTAKRSKFVAPRGTGKLRLDTYAGTPDAPRASNDLASPHRFSSRQLKENAKFTLDVGEALELPVDESALSGNAWAQWAAEPMILRHPKTGRIVGAQNIVMAYSRPFSPADVGKYGGKKEARLANPQIPQELAAVDRRNRELYSQQLDDRFKANRNTVLMDKHLSHRYQYGLNSAGVFVYAQDLSPGGPVINEVVTIPTANLTRTPKSQTPELESPVVLIRPVSDDRGFEVIGHYRYGRSVALKDGRLIANDPRKIAKVDFQLALSGDLAAMLSAQSRGLTSVSTGYSDPAAALANMGDESPKVENPEFVVERLYDPPAILGSDAQRGTEGGVEATQLSRALTLAEMAVQSTYSRQNEDCACLMGRSDLAFMSSGYAVKVLTGVSDEDASTVTSTGAGLPVEVSGAANLVQEVNRIEAEITIVQARLVELGQAGDVRMGAIKPSGDKGQDQIVRETVETRNKLTQKLVAAQAELNRVRANYHSPNSMLMQTKSEVISRVDDFLEKLYAALDAPHQMHEKELRGDLLPPQNVDPLSLDPSLGRAPVQQRRRPARQPATEFAPPFSAPNRYMLGDQSAAIGSVQTNVDNLSKAWSDFGSSLKSNTASRALSTQISQDKASIARLTAARDQLIKQRDSSTQVVGVDIQKQIDTMSTQIADLQQQVTDNQTKLSTVK